MPIGVPGVRVTTRLTADNARLESAGPGIATNRLRGIGLGDRGWCGCDRGDLYRADSCRGRLRLRNCREGFGGDPGSHVMPGTEMQVNADPEHVGVRNLLPIAQP